MTPDSASAEPTAAPAIMNVNFDQQTYSFTVSVEQCAYMSFCWMDATHLD
jgi:hypothetical protein